MAGTIRKRSWVTRKGEPRTAFFADYYDQHGQRHRKAFPTHKAADGWLTDTRTEVKAGIHTPDANSIKVADATAIWLRHCALDGLERGTLRVYDQYVRLYIDALIGPKKLSRLTAPDVVAFADVLLEQASRQRARKVIATLRLVLAEMQRRGLVAQNVALAVRVKLSNRDEVPVAVGIDVPSKAEIQAMLQHAAGRNRAQLVTAALTGSRTSELRALVWPELDFDRRLLHVRRRADWRGTIGAVKSKNGYRSIPMTPLLVNTLREWQLACPPFAANRLGLVFPGRDGKVASHTRMQTDFDDVQRAAGILDAKGAPKYSLHALRHFFASWGIDQGFAPKRLQELLGHASIQLTYDVYGHWLGDIADDHARLARGEAALFGPRLVD
jgi:integrase